MGCPGSVPGRTRLGSESNDIRQAKYGLRYALSKSPPLLMLDAEIGLRHPRQIVQPNRLMSNLTWNRLWFIAVIAFSCNFCLAQSSLQFSFDFGNSTPLIDMNGVFQVEDEIVGAGGTGVPLSYGVGITHDSRGVLRGSGTAIVQIGDDFEAATYHASGRVSGGGDNLRVFLVVHLSGRGTVGGVDTRFSISVAYHLVFNPDSGALEGASRGTANLSRVGESRVHSDGISVGLPGGGDGSWTLNGTAVPLNRMVGSTQIILSGGRAVNGLLRGRFNPDAISVARFTGTDGDRGSAATFSFSTTEGGVVLETIQGRILGQRVVQ